MLPKGLLKEYSKTLSMLMRLMDMLTVFGAGWIAFFLRFHTSTFSSQYLNAIIIGVLLSAIIFAFFNIYASVRGKGLLSYFVVLCQATFVLALILAGLAFFTKSGEVYSRTWFSLWMAAIFTFLVTSRCFILLVLRFMRSMGLNERRVIILGAGELGIRLATTVQEALWTGFKIETFLDDHASDKPSTIADIPVLKTPKHLSQFLIEVGADEIWIALPLQAEPRVKKILYELRNSTINLRFALDIFGLDLLNHSVTDIAGVPVLNIRSSPMIGINRLIKALEDRIIAAILLILISPILLIISIGIKLTSKGPILFKQHRHGWDGQIIKVYKFRTMYQHKELGGNITQATLNDERITPFGKFLRRTSLDELPQFFNVLQGRMSIVGPRPHAIVHGEFYKDAIHTYMQRHRVKPGITGWAQVNGWRGETDTLLKMQKRIEYDLYYINNWSLGFDVKIILLTLFRGFISRNAY